MYLKWGKNGKKKSVKIDRQTAYRIAMISEPEISGPTHDTGSCLDCGGPAYLNCSPRIINHAPNCRGLDRANRIAAILESLG